MMTAFFANGYEVGKSPKGDPVLMPMIGEDAKTSFVLPAEVITSLLGHLADPIQKHQ